MNNRIRELATQALQLVVDEHANGDESRLNTDSHVIKELINEKFAELLIAECAWVLRTNIEGDPYTGEPFDNSANAAIRYGIHSIEDHFEVK